MKLNDLDFNIILKQKNSRNFVINILLGSHNSISKI
jgi:hypothetical protein